MRARVIEILKETPRNAHQLSDLINVDYKTIRHHIEVLEKNNMITSMGSGYGVTYFLSATLEDNYAIFEDIRKRI
jgi:DNA-binding transcriptional ArsR family regulator